MDLASAALRQCTALEPSELAKMPNSRLESLLPARRRASAYTSVLGLGGQVFGYGLLATVLRLVSLLTSLQTVVGLHRVSKNDTDVAHYNFNAHQPISVIFGRDVADIVCYRIICFPTSPY